MTKRSGPHPALLFFIERVNELRTLHLTILGNNSALPAYGRHPTSQLLSMGQHEVLIDCGEGALATMMKLGLRWNKINRILISHLHGDHFFGLFGLLTSMSLFGRAAPLPVHGPAALEPIIQALTAVSGYGLCFPIHFHALPEGAALIAEEADYEVHCFPTEHRIPCWGFRMISRTSGRTLLPERCRELDIPVDAFRALKAGEDFVRENGEVISSDAVTEPGPPPRSYAYCADTVYTESFLPYIAGADLVYHESTYLHDATDKALLRMHATARQAAMIAQKAGAGRLLLGHYSSRYRDVRPFAEEAGEIFPGAIASVEGKRYEV